MRRAQGVQGPRTMSCRMTVAGMALVSLLVQGPLMASPDSSGIVAGRLSITPEGQPPGELTMPGTGEEILLIPQTAAFDEGLQAVKAKWLPIVKAQQAAMQKARQQFRASRTGEERQRATAAMTTEARKLIEVRRDYEQAVAGHLAQHALRRTKADVEGKFRFEGIPEGRYYVHGRFEILRMEYRYYWLFPVELRPGHEVQADLNRENATQLFD